ncbi:hypothetical protein [Paractinoplanes durhamensis]|uniref:Uncharacterized protein n=1 Tax=Paractinoplanes durhamensis TaxID=113563 RepID=A0ABQ3ZE63_9ACTN|nr:hypothetical protein [Actinoplanes durhamensis]GIE08070.1 hypothetical protein Adu01nite_94200 [Actinoplanes durhamensis]
MSDQANQLWATLSDFQGADLRAAAATSLDELDGVVWSDTTASGGATRWPDQLRLALVEHSTEAEHGVFIVRLGTSIGATSPAV